MASKHIVSMSMILTYFKNHEKQFKRGENAYSSGHCLNFSFDSEVHPALLKGKVKASMKNKAYDVEVSVDFLQGTISGCTCNCPRGQDVCHHMSALCLYAYNNLSSTDTACSWSVREANVHTETTQKLSDIFPPSKPEYQPVARLANEQEINTFKQALTENVVGFSWLLQPEPSVESFILPQIEEILISSEYNLAANKKMFFIEKCAVDAKTQKIIANLTKGQTTNSNWLLARKHRLTASKFGAVLRACHRGKYSVSFYKNLLEGYNIDAVKAVQWGAQHEKIALQRFTATTGLDVESTGLWIHSCDFLGASPDGLVSDGQHLVEVKCPYKFRNLNLTETLKQDKSYVICISESGETLVNKSHNFYHQIQGQMYICDKELCYLVVWTPEDTQIVAVQKDPEWTSNFDVLYNFYLDKFIPWMLGTK